MRTPRGTREVHTRLWSLQLVGYVAVSLKQCTLLVAIRSIVEDELYVTLVGPVCITLKLTSAQNFMNSTELKKITDDWKVSSKIHCGITDGASNIKGAVRMNQWNNLVCFAHQLNLVVSCAIEKVDEVREIIDQVKNVVSFFHRSTKAAEKLRQIQTSFQLPEHKLIQQVSHGGTQRFTCWSDIWNNMNPFKWH